MGSTSSHSLPGPLELGEPALQASLWSAHCSRHSEGADCAAWCWLPLMKPQTAGDRAWAWNHSCMQMTRAKFYISRDGPAVSQGQTGTCRVVRGPAGPGEAPAAAGGEMPLGTESVSACLPTHRGGSWGQGSAGSRLATAQARPRTRLPREGGQMPSNPVGNEGPLGASFGDTGRTGLDRKPGP